MSETAIVLVHGFWSGRGHGSKVIVALSRKGCGSVRTVENPLTSLADDANRNQKNGGRFTEDRDRHRFCVASTSAIRARRTSFGSNPPSTKCRHPKSLTGP